MIKRNRITQEIRQSLVADGFLEMETPFLTKSTPEGARDFLVPSRLHPGKLLRPAAEPPALQADPDGGGL